MKYALRRLLTLLVTMVIVSLLAFAAFDLISGSPAEIMLGTQATEERGGGAGGGAGTGPPLPGAVSLLAGGLLHRGSGTSYSYHQPVWELIAPKVGVTLWLSVLSFLLIAAVSIPLGLRPPADPAGSPTPRGRWRTSS